MRTFSGLKIFTPQNINTGQLDIQYIKLSGNNSIANFNAGIRIAGREIPPYQDYPGNSGDIAWSFSHLYICLSGDGTTGLWSRLSLEDF
jgi:hypothetical protein